MKDYSFVYCCTFCGLERHEYGQLLRHMLRAHLGAYAEELGESMRDARRQMVAMIEEA